MWLLWDVLCLATDLRLWGLGLVPHWLSDEYDECDENYENDKDTAYGNRSDHRVWLRQRDVKEQWGGDKASRQGARQRLTRRLRRRLAAPVWEGRRPWGWADMKHWSGVGGGRWGCCRLPPSVVVCDRLIVSWAMDRDELVLDGENDTQLGFNGQSQRLPSITNLRTRARLLKAVLCSKFIQFG